METSSDSNKNNICDEYIDSIPFKAGKLLASPAPGDDVVITGLAGRYPNSHNVYHFRDNLYNKIDMVSSDNRRWETVHPEIPERSGKIYDVNKFDASFFGIHYRQAHAMDPVGRILLEKSVECILDAGFHPSELAGTRTGVFVGCSFNESEEPWFFLNQKKQQFSITGNERSMLAHRISYALKLKGPSFVVDTACSSSLYALDNAYRAIRSGTCDMALVCGGNVCLHPLITLQFARLGVLSQDGACKVFDDSANGYVRSETIAAILLQKSKDARRIYAQIVHSKTNSDGFKPQNINYPSRELQKTLLEEFYSECGVDPNDISYMEAHGTGTTVGDPEELQAIDEVICKKRQTPLLIGSVKSNIGHSEPSAGMGSITKVIISMENGYIAPNIHFQKNRQGVEALESGRMKVVTEKTQFPNNTNRLVGINSFGFGGANGHVLLRWSEKPKENKGLPKDDIPRLVCFSSRVKEGIEAFQNDLAERKIDVEYIRLLHQIFRKNIHQHSYRGYVVVDKSGEIKRSSAFYPQNRKKVYLGVTSFGESWKNIAKQFSGFDVFQDQMEKINKILLSKNLNILENLNKNNSDQLNTKLGNLAVQLSLIHFLKTLQIQIDGYFGCDPICAYLDNLLNLQDTVYSALLTTPLIFTKKSSKWISIENFSSKNSITIFLGTPQPFPKNIPYFAFDSNTNFITFLETLGKLYEYGHDLALDVLYPPVQFPVGRGTPMISPLIKWDHRYDWYVTQYEHQGLLSKSGEHCVGVGPKDDNWAYIKGHMIDGRNIFPAMGYVALAWETLSKAKGLMLSDMKVVLDRIKFVRAITIPKESKVKLTIMVQKGSGEFEVIEGDSVVVSGRIRQFVEGKQEEIDLPVATNKSGGDWIPLNQKDVYKELRLRGYDYTGLFKQIQEYNLKTSIAKIKWEGNWVAFMDNMLQMKILQFDSRNLYVPTGISKLIIDAKQHLSYMQQFGENAEVPVYLHKKSDIIKCGGIEIRGLTASAIPRRKQRGDPVLEKYIFVPHETNLSLTESIRVIAQLAIENLPGATVKIIELVDESMSENSELISPILLSVLGDLPLIQPEITIFSNKQLDVPNLNVEDKKLKDEVNCTIVVGSEVLQRSVILNQAFGAVKENGFVLSREPLDFIPDQTHLTGIDIICHHTTSTEKLYLIRKNSNFDVPKIVDISNQTETFTWLETLQQAVKSNTSNVIVLAQNHPLSGIMGLVNCIRREPNCSHVKMVFTEDNAPPFDLTDPFYKNELKKNLAINIFKNGQWGSYRHLLLKQDELIQREHIFPLVKQPGDLSSFRWVAGPLCHNTQIPPEKQLVYNYYAALNFRDIMTSSGKITPDGLTKDKALVDFFIGFEFAGRTKNGKRVMGINGGALGTLVLADIYCTWPVPDLWTLEDAATVPVVYSTVLYALLVLVSIKKGKSILIHAGSGGVGQAAINICLHHGLTVYTTVGSEEKRNFIKKTYPQISDTHIGNSRNTSFEQMIYKETNGRGVDYVLNSLSEDKLIASVRCLAKGGNFLEIGKYDILNNNSLNLALLKKDASFYGVMIDNIFQMDPKNKLVLFDLIKNGIRDGYVKPLVRTTFKMDEIEQAFRYMAVGKHIGKVLIKIRQEEQQSVFVPQIETFSAKTRFFCSLDKVQIIIGGLGGFGLELADWLVKRGARHLLLTSRKGIIDGYQAYRTRVWQEYHCKIYISTADITTFEGCNELIAEGLRIAPIESIFNLAVILQDGLLENQTVEQFKTSLAPKAFATTHLDIITREQCPDLANFVVFSSVSCGRGNYGQSNYGMANAVMERICEQRKRDGLPALAIQWGAVGDVGLVAEMMADNSELTIGGTLPQCIFNCLHVLDKLLFQNDAVVSSMIVAEKRSFAGGSNNIVTAVANILGLENFKTLSLHAPLSELGMDSITAVEIKQTLEREYEVFLTPQDIRTMTFARLQEIQEERENSNGEKEKKDKPIGGFEMIIRHMNNEEQSKISIKHLKSKLDEELDAPYILFFPGIEGVAKVLEPLALNLKARIDCLQYLYENQVDTVQEMALNLLETVQSLLDKNKPFNIIGYSFGVLVGLEIVSLLEERGYKGRFVALDGSAELLGKLVKENLDIKSENVFQTAFLLQMMSLHTPIDPLLKINNKLLAASNLEQRLDYIEELLPNNTQHSVNYIRLFSTAIYKRLKATVNYKPTYSKIKSELKLFKPESQSIIEISEDYKLGDVCEGDVEIKVFKGNHVTILENEELADVINQFIQE